MHDYYIIISDITQNDGNFSFSEIRQDCFLPVLYIGHDHSQYVNRHWVHQLGARTRGRPQPQHRHPAPENCQRQVQHPPANQHQIHVESCEVRLQVQPDHEREDPPSGPVHPHPRSPQQRQIYLPPHYAKARGGGETINGGSAWSYLVNHRLYRVSLGTFMSSLVNMKHFG